MNISLEKGVKAVRTGFSKGEIQMNTVNKIYTKE